MVGTDAYGSEEALLEQLGSIARRLSEASTLQETLQHIVDLGHDLLDGCDGVSLMLIGRSGHIETPASSSEAAYDSDLAQFETGEGPCLDAIKHEHTIVMQDLTADDRWPAYRKRALDLGIRSMLSFQLFVTGDSLGALDMYSRRPHAFTPRSLLIGQLFAAQASVAMKGAITEAGLEAALRSRDVIGQAKGIVMARSRITATMAADYLRWLSQQRNQPLRDLAAQIAETGEIPGS